MYGKIRLLTVTSEQMIQFAISLVTRRWFCVINRMFSTRLFHIQKYLICSAAQENSWCKW